MRTIIYTTKKLEKFAKKLINKNGDGDIENSGILGNWNATMFYVDRKKCLLFTNKKTKYNVILTNIKAADLNKVGDLFKNAFYTQLIYDGIISSFDHIATLTGDLVFSPTDNDRSTTGFQNQRISDFDWWKEEFVTLENMPIKELTGRINNVPIHIGKSRKMEDFTYSSEEMKKLILQ
ncbi:DUF6933 domain-containing protein [Salinimicrobium terrae]|uniref:DUF6933 domain-containing protein n=1 Tax=Salinimicrobium terrae TaxID=470866 RepID=UPI00041AA5EF|nr:hypothetical protein [Salinimicrobium terrae]